MEELLKKFLNLGWIKQTDKIIVVCGSNDDDKRLKNLKFTNYLITSIYKKFPGIKHYQQTDAQQLPFADRSFDTVIVNGGLHHCDSPHRALNEMYRIAKKTIIVNESQDSLLIRLLIKLKLVLEYEMIAIDNNGGGLNNTAIPNFIYRWNKREVKKTINSFDPTKIHQINFFTKFHFPPSFLESDSSCKKNMVNYLSRQLTKYIINFVVLMLNLVAKNQGNDFAFIVRKDISPFQPWINLSKRSLGLLGRTETFISHD